MLGVCVSIGPARFLFIKPLSLRVSAMHIVQIILVIDKRIVKLVVTAPDESVSDKLAPQALAMVLVGCLLIPGLVEV